MKNLYTFKIIKNVKFKDIINPYLEKIDKIKSGYIET